MEGPAHHLGLMGRPWLRVAAPIAAVLVIAVSGIALVMAPPPSASPTSHPSTEAAATGTAVPTPASIRPTATPLPSTPASPTSEPLVAFVPVVGFWSSERSITRAELARVVGEPGPRHVLVAPADRDAVARALGVDAAAGVLATDTASIKRTVQADSRALGIIRASDVTPQVRALAVDGLSLFGAERLHDVARWPLLVASATREAMDAPLWTLVAGGDVMLDRYTHVALSQPGRGGDWVWNGGTAAISGYRCCGFGTAKLAVGRRTGNAGAVRTLLQSADITVVNLEAPAPNTYTHHLKGYVFNTDRSLLPSLHDAGIDVVSLANNHMGNAGTSGVLQTIANVEAAGLGHAGAGASMAIARRPAWETAAGVRVAILAYDAVRPDYWVTANRPGTAGLRLTDVVADVRTARAAGANVVIVMPHWGAEYTDAVSAEQRRESAAITAAGADAILGSHSHWAGPVQLSPTPRGKAIVAYSLGDLAFDLVHDERTQEGLLADLTFAGDRLVQVDLDPTLVLDDAQPNLLDRAGADRVLDAVHAASRGMGW